MLDSYFLMKIDFENDRLFARQVAAEAVARW